MGRFQGGRPEVCGGDLGEGETSLTTPCVFLRTVVALAEDAGQVSCDLIEEEMDASDHMDKEDGEETAEVGRIPIV